MFVVPQQVTSLSQALIDASKIVSIIASVGDPEHLPHDVANIFKRHLDLNLAQSSVKGISIPVGLTIESANSDMPNFGAEADSLYDGAEADPLYDQAVAYVLKTRRASISAVQRQLRIGYNHAARMIEDMERAGLVSSMQSNGNRDVLAHSADTEA